ncbi:MAG: hypothetical protein ACI8PP_002836 [Candidatus Pseudothioglobus sp.]
MIWRACNGALAIRPVVGTVHRLVESQAQVATLSYVDTLAEQALLEDMLDGVKPAYLPDSHQYHYLLKTPFRYPPLHWGSRFGRVHEPGIFYGARTTETTLAESAYYRLVFWLSMNAPPVKATIDSAHTLFCVGYKSLQGVRLHAPPFDRFADALTHPSDYKNTQQLGSAMREAEIEAFEYASARDPNHGFCVGLFKPNAFSQKRPKQMSQWLCQVSGEEVAFKQVGQGEVTRFGREAFTTAGMLPLPASQ